MIQKVNRLTIFKNYFTPVGIVANHEIKKICAFKKYGDIYQKKLQNGSMVLQHEIKYPDVKETTTLFLNSNGVQNIIKRENRYSKKGVKLISILKKYFPGISFQEKQVVINTKNGKIEEKAIKYSGIGDGSLLSVTSYQNRKSEFPSTRLASAIHPATANKVDFENGSFGYTEIYPY